VSLCSLLIDQFFLKAALNLKNEFKIKLMSPKECQISTSGRTDAANENGDFWKISHHFFYIMCIYSTFLYSQPPFVSIIFRNLLENEMHATRFLIFSVACPARLPQVAFIALVTPFLARISGMLTEVGVVVHGLPTHVTHIVFTVGTTHAVTSVTFRELQPAILADAYHPGRHRVGNILNETIQVTTLRHLIETHHPQVRILRLVVPGRPCMRSLPPQAPKISRYRPVCISFLPLCFFIHFHTFNSWYIMRLPLTPTTEQNPTVRVPAPEICRGGEILKQGVVTQVIPTCSGWRAWARGYGRSTLIFLQAIEIRTLSLAKEKSVN